MRSAMEITSYFFLEKQYEISKTGFIKHKN